MRKSLRDGFRGCMIGGVIGDAMGSPVECKYWNGISDDRVRKEFASLPEESSKKFKVCKRYTDDTAMARELVEALIQSKNGSFPSAQTLATRFYQSYFREPDRGYGSGVVSVFKLLKNSKAEDPFTPASKQFSGTGSYGNGAAMRVHPIALFSHGHLSDLEMRKHVEEASRITHAHHEGINGALIQCTAVRLALQQKPLFLETLLDLSKDMDRSENGSGENEETFASQMKFVESIIKSEGAEEFDLGNDISALKSVPTAIYSFLKSKDSLCSFPEVDSPFQRALMIAIGFGGDTDTIASMTGAIAGAWYGESNIPQFLMDQCEWVDGAREAGDALYELYETRKKSSLN